MGDGRDAKVAEQDLVLYSDEHVLRLDITMDQAFIMGVLQGTGHLFDVGDDGGQQDSRALWVTLAQGAVGCVFHDDERDTSFDAEVQDLYDVRVLEAKGACLDEEAVQVVLGELWEDFDGDLSVAAIEVLGQVDFAEATGSQQAREAVVVELLSYPISHG